MDIRVRREDRLLRIVEKMDILPGTSLDERPRTWKGTLQKNMDVLEIEQVAVS